MLYRYTGITNDEKIKSGLIEANNKSNAIKKLKNSENMLIVTNLKQQISNPVIVNSTKFIQKQSNEFQNRLNESMKQQRIKNAEKKQKKLNEASTTKNIPTEEPKDALGKIKQFLTSDINAIGKKKEQKVEINEEMYNKLVNVLRKHNSQESVPDEDIDIEIRERKPKMREPNSLKKIDSAKDKKLNFDLIDNQNNPLIKKNLKLKVKEKEVILFTRRLQIMLASGMSLIKSLQILSKTKNQTMQHIIESVSENLQQGETFSSSLSKFPNQFDYTYIALMSIGENSGSIDSILMDILQSKEQKMKIAKKIKTATIYPTIIGIVLMLVLLLGSLFFIPSFESMFAEQGTELPGITKVVFGIADAMPLIIGIMIGVIIIYNFLRKTNREVEIFHRTYFDKILLNIPLVKNIVSASYMYSFSYTMALMLRNGIRLSDALTLSKKTIKNIYIQNEIIDMGTLMINGLTFSEAMAQQEHFDDILVNIILTGEESGQLSSALSQIANYYNDELDKLLDRISEMVQPVSMLLIAILVLPVIVAIYLPILDMSSGAGIGI